MDQGKIFISHSSKDLFIVESFVEIILRLGLNIHTERIFCSSMEGHGVQSGEYIPDRLKEEIKKSIIAFLFISKNYKSSEICLNELGAAWVSLEKTNVIPILLPGTDFKELGFLDVGRYGVKLYEKAGLTRLIQDNKGQLNPEFDLGQLTKQIDNFLNQIESQSQNNPEKNEEASVIIKDEWKECYTNNLYPFNQIMRKAVPTKSDGVYNIESKRSRNKILSDLSNSDLLEDLWYRFSGGDYYVEKLAKLPNGNWLVSQFNIELKISSMWVSKNAELQYEFILIKTEPLDPYKITSDVGGESYCVGILNDGTVISPNEMSNGYAIIDGETIDLSNTTYNEHNRYNETNWIFFASDYHKIGFNFKETIDFCTKLDSGEIEVNQKNIMNFLYPLRNHPTVIKYR